MTDKSKIAIIGAGLAGLTAALRLNQKKYQVEVYEARKRVGGRVFTALMKNIQDDYVIIELGGQNIADGNQARNILNLAAELDLKIIDESIPLSSSVSFEEKYHDFEQILSQLEFPTDKIDEIVDIAAADSTSILEVINKIFAGNELAKMAFSTRLKAYEGLDVSRQSIYHNIDTLKCILKGGVAMAHQASANKEFLIQKIAGGNAKLPLKIAEILVKKIHLDKALVKVVKKEQQIKLQFHDNSEATCDKLILAIPASTYCNIKFEDDLIPSWQLSKISRLEYGNNYKVFAPVKYDTICPKILVNDKGILFFNHQQKIMLIYLTKDVADLNQEIAMLNNSNLGVKISTTKIIEAIDQQMIKYDNSVTHLWSSDFYCKGSYCGYGTILGNELDKTINYNGIKIKEIFKPVENQIFFIGEHTTILEEIGTMEAAVESAERIVKIF